MSNTRIVQPSWMDSTRQWRFIRLSQRPSITTWQSHLTSKARYEGLPNYYNCGVIYLNNHDLCFNCCSGKDMCRKAPKLASKSPALRLVFLSTIVLLFFELFTHWTDDSTRPTSMPAVFNDWNPVIINDKDGEGLLQTSITTIGLAVFQTIWEISNARERHFLPHVHSTVTLLESNREIQNTLNEKPHICCLQPLGNLCRDRAVFTEARPCVSGASGGRRRLAWSHVTLDTVTSLGRYTSQCGSQEAGICFKRC